MSRQATQLQSQLTSMLDQPALDRIASETGVTDSKAHRRAVNIVLSPVVQKLHELARSENGHRVLTDVVERMPSEGVDGAALAEHLFADLLPSTAHRLATDCNLTALQGQATVEKTSAWAFTTAASLVDSPRDLPNKLAGRRDSAPTAQPVRTSERTPKSPKVKTVLQPDVGTSESENGGKGMTGKLVGAGLAALLVAGGIFALTSGGDDAPVEVATQQADEEPASDDVVDNDGAADSDDVAPAPTAAPAAVAPASDDSNDEPAPATEEVSDSDTDDGSVSDDEATVVASPTGTALTVPLRDTSNGAANAGAIDLTFDSETGQICYAVGALAANPPYAAQINAGDFGSPGFIVADLGEVVAGTEGCIDNPPASTLAILAEPSRYYASVQDTAGAWVVRGQLSETVDRPGIVPFAVPIANSGILEIGFDTRTGEICHDVSETGIETEFTTEIRSGKMGITGDLLVELGTLQDSSTSCISNAIDDTLAILADPSSHYAELRDAGNEWSLRSQLALANVAIDPVPAAVTIDTTGGGASIRLEDAIVYLEGDVANEQVAAEMLSWLDDVIAPVENNLNVVPGSPPPSGRIVLADGLTFETGSAVLADVEPNTAIALLQLANSHPDWLITIVGHTDNVGSDTYNEELSLSRADALRTLMLETGFEPSRVSVRGAGASEPIADNSTEEGRAKNRRLEFEFRPPT